MASQAVLKWLGCSLAGTVIGFLLPTYKLRLVAQVWPVIMGRALMENFYIWYLRILRQHTLRARIDGGNRGYYVVA